MRFHHNLCESQADASRAYLSALTIAAGYLLGGLVPLTPYFFAETNQLALWWSMGVMALALFVFGYAKTFLVGERKRGLCVKAGVQMMALGGVAAAAAMGCVKAIGS
jgi:VIT1/CCC1 family predicted Fe2+/Mn2+ transporter